MRIIFRVCERIQVLDYGKSIAVGTPEEIRTDQAGGRRVPGRQGSASLLRLTDVSVHYGRVPAVQHLSLEVNEGELVGLVGHNGAGKSTTLWTITGVLKPSSGTITFLGKSIAGVSPGRDPARRHRARAGEPPHLRPADRRREPADRHAAAQGPQAGGCGHQADVRALRGARQLLRPQRLDALGRRAAAARDRAGAARAAQAPAPRRADARAGAADRRPGLRDPPGAARGRASRSCWSSRTRRERSRSPTAPT